MKCERNPQRSGVRATMIPWTEPPLELIDDRWHGPPGAFIEREGTDGSHWALCCPGCGQLGSPRQGQTWQVTTGSFEDVTTLSLTPSIQKSCCGWHGWLCYGVFVTKCPGT